MSIRLEHVSYAYEDNSSKKNYALKEINLEIKKEEERLELINTYENEGYTKGYLYIGGIDEAGRGPLAGPVVASVVVFKPNTKIEGINDSKKLSESKREELFDRIKEEALDYGIGIVNNEDIDKYNILNATYMAMNKAINALTADAAEFDAYVAKCKELALFDTGVTATYGDKLITLSTCDHDLENGRLVVVAKRMTE